MGGAGCSPGQNAEGKSYHSKQCEGSFELWVKLGFSNLAYKGMKSYQVCSPAFPAPNHR